MKNALLSDYLLEVQDATFQYGAWDCARFVNGWIEKLGLDSHLGFVKGLYKGQAGAMRILEGGHIDQLVTSRLGPPKPVLWAVCGDVILSSQKQVTDAQGFQVLGIFSGQGRATFLGEQKLYTSPVDSSFKAWGL